MQDQRYFFVSDHDLHSDRLDFPVATVGLVTSVVEFTLTLTAFIKASISIGSFTIATKSETFEQHHYTASFTMNL
jgi:hypothetical protein